MKICSRCRESLNENEFYKDKATKDGLQNNCKKCQKKYAYSYSSNNQSYITERQLCRQRYKEGKISKDEYLKERNRLRKKYNINYNIDKE